MGATRPVTRTPTRVGNGPFLYRSACKVSRRRGNEARFTSGFHMKPPHVGSAILDCANLSASRNTGRATGRRTPHYVTVRDSAPFLAKIWQKIPVARTDFGVMLA